MTLPFRQQRAEDQEIRVDTEKVRGPALPRGEAGAGITAQAPPQDLLGQGHGCGLGRRSWQEMENQAPAGLVLGPPESDHSVLSSPCPEGLHGSLKGCSPEIQERRGLVGPRKGGCSSVLPCRGARSPQKPWPRGLNGRRRRPGESRAPQLPSQHSQAQMPGLRGEGRDCRQAWGAGWGRGPAGPGIFLQKVQRSSQLLPLGQLDR